MKKNYVNVPVILQMEALECGAASLAMVLAYYKRFIPLERLRMDCNVSRDGSNAKYIIKAAAHHGLTAKIFKMSVAAIRKKTSFPMIIHWNFNHFVVLCGFKKDKAIINDPASGRIFVDMKDFKRSFTGIAITFSPGEDFVTEGKPMNAMSFVVKRLHGAMLPLTFIITMGLFLSVTELLKPVIYKIFTDNILSGNTPQWISPMITAMLLLLAAGFIINSVKNIYIYKLKAKMTVSSSSIFMWHILRLPVEFFSQRFTGDIASRQKSNAEVADTLCVVIAPVVLNIILVGIYFVIMIYYDIVMAFIGLAMAAINVLLILFLAKKNRNAAKNIQRDGGKLSGIIMSSISMIETIKASGAEYGFFEKIAGYQAKFNNAFLDMIRLNTYVSIAPQIISGICNGIILVLGVYNIFSGKFTIGTLMAFQGFLNMFLSPVGSLIDSIQSFQDVGGKMERLDDVLNYHTDTEISIDEENDQYEILSGEVEIKNLTFGYNPLAEPIISNFSLKAKKGSMIALVGGSGSGKSTIAKVISGLYKPLSGEILFDGKQIGEIDRYVFKNSVAVVDQSISLFGGTIRENISMWDETMTEETIVQACKDACIHDEIMAKKGDYDYIITEGGGNFSGGQRQRLEIARAFAAQPSIIILDEATSALDPVTEKLIMDAVKRRNITCFVIAHRLSTIRDADEIIVLDYGKEVERGTHELLLSMDGYYAGLVKSE